MAKEFRYKKMGYLALNVTDVEKYRHFATEVFGLDDAGEAADGGHFFRLGKDHHDILVMPAEKPGFVRSGWELESQQELDKAFEHYKKLGLNPAWVGNNEIGDLHLERAFRVVDPIIGSTWEYYAGMSQISTPRQNTITSFQGGKHFGLVVPDCKKMNDYMVQNMGFMVSDYFEGWKASLLRAWPNPNHHSFAPLGIMAPKPCFQHVAFMVNEIDDIGKLFNRVKKHDVKIQFGIGRHPTSGSIHLYVYGPDYFVWEYTLGMEQFPEENPREARRMSAAPENLDLWGAEPDLEFGKFYPPVLSSL